MNLKQELFQLKNSIEQEESLIKRRKETLNSFIEMFGFDLITEELKEEHLEKQEQERTYIPVVIADESIPKRDRNLSHKEKLLVDVIKLKLKSYGGRRFTIEEVFKTLQLAGHFKNVEKSNQTSLPRIFRYLVNNGIVERVVTGGGCKPHKFIVKDLEL